VPLFRELVELDIALGGFSAGSQVHALGSSTMAWRCLQVAAADVQRSTPVARTTVTSAASGHPTVGFGMVGIPAESAPYVLLELGFGLVSPLKSPSERSKRANSGLQALEFSHYCHSHMSHVP
jgi:hypothetical protein